MPDIRGWRFAVLGVVIAVMLVLPLVIKSSFALEILIRVLLFSPNMARDSSAMVDQLLQVELFSVTTKS